MPPSPRQDRTIVLDIASETDYPQLLDNDPGFRQALAENYAADPELFPAEFEQGFHFHGMVYSKKQKVWQRRIKLKATGEVYQIRPSFVTPYMSARVEEVSDLLLLRYWGVPFWMLARLGGRDPMYWWRLYASLGRFSIVGTTVKEPEKLPGHLLADEKHTRQLNEKVYVATTVAENCFLGAAVAEGAGERELTEAYSVFRSEARELDPTYTPKTVTTDGWKYLQQAWQTLFAGITLILCFLHSWLKIKRRCRRDKSLLREVGNKVWHVYRATSKAIFAQRLRRLGEWAARVLPQESSVREQLEKLCQRRDQFTPYYAHPKAKRTTNGIDRLMDYQDRQLYSMRYFRGTLQSGQLVARAMALLWNFHLYDQGHSFSPFAQLNGFFYHQDWLQNFFIAASLQRRPLSSHKIRDD